MRSSKLTLRENFIFHRKFGMFLDEIILYLIFEIFIFAKLHKNAKNIS